MKRSTFIVIQAVWLTVPLKRPCNVNEQSSEHASDILHKMKKKGVDDNYECEIFCLNFSSQVLQPTFMEMEMTVMSVLNLTS